MKATENLNNRMTDEKKLPFSPKYQVSPLRPLLNTLGPRGMTGLLLLPDPI